MSPQEVLDNIRLYLKLISSINSSLDDSEENDIIDVTLLIFNLIKQFYLWIWENDIYIDINVIEPPTISLRVGIWLKMNIAKIVATIGSINSEEVTRLMGSLLAVYITDPWPIKVGTSTKPIIPIKVVKLNFPIP